MNLHAQGGPVSPGKMHNAGSEGSEYFVPKKSLSEADEAVKRFESEEFAKEFRENLHSAIWKIFAPPINRAIKRIIEDSKRQRAEQWQSVADARERQEKRDIIWNGHLMNHDDPRAKVPRDDGITRTEFWSAVAVLTAIVITILVFYFLTCGLRVDGECWK